MSYDEPLASRIRAILSKKRGVTEKKMFGGLAFLLPQGMFCGLIHDDLMVRVGPERYEELLKETHARPMDFTGRPMKGYVFVSTEGLRRPAMLARWVGRGLEFVSTLRPAASPRPSRARRSGGSRGPGSGR